MTASIRTVAVIGAGTIGASWAALFSAAGRQIRVYDPSPECEAFVRDYLDAAWPALEALRMVAPGGPGPLAFFSSPQEAVEGADFIQESVPERLEIKHAIYRQIEPSLTPDAVVASSASGLLLADMQQGWRDPGRFVLGHPFNPPHLIPLVEVLGNAETSEAALELAEAFYAACKKVTIRLNKEVPGHVANRLQAALWREAINLAVEGVASVSDIDKAVATGPGLRWAVMGPHMLFSLGSGGQGMEGFCERFGDGIQAWWETMGRPGLTPEVRRILADGVKDEEAGRDFAALSAERDRKLVAILKAIGGG